MVVIKLVFSKYIFVTRQFQEHKQKNHVAGSHRHLSGRTSYEGIWGCPLNLPQHNCRLFLNRVFLRWRRVSASHEKLVKPGKRSNIMENLENAWNLIFHDPK